MLKHEEIERLERLAAEWPEDSYCREALGDFARWARSRIEPDLPVEMQSFLEIRSGAEALRHQAAQVLVDARAEARRIEDAAREAAAAQTGRTLDRARRQLLDAVRELER